MNSFAKSYSPPKGEIMPDKVDSQVLYNGRWIPRKHFRVFIYNKFNESKLVNTYEEYSDLISSGIWFSECQESLQADNVTDIAKAKRGRKCQNQVKA